MTTSHFQQSFNIILGYEGGYSNNPKDPGGPTNLGVTQSTLGHWLGRAASIAEVQALTPGLVAPIYRTNFWNAVHGDALPAGVDLITFDAAVNSGPGRAAKLLQAAAGATVDGAIGPATLAAVTAMKPVDVVNKFTAAHEAFFKSLPTFSEFGHGWLNRLYSIQALALSWAEG